ncbi:MAG: divalent-cation tolerance protein CutA [Pseudomonadota bacterium]|nr:divalent-cation tolerance protein CutA [Pseudomonadota bacterium]
MDIQLIITNLPNRDVALKLATRLVDSGLAACANIMAPCTSVYIWQGALETTEEIPLLIKALKQNYSAIEKEIQGMHPYELPEIIAVPLADGLPQYLNWIAAVSSREMPPPIQIKS